MSIELDHLFIFTAAGAPAAEDLIHFGLTEGEPNDHPGQGTACRRFFFHNFMLELLWVKDEDAARSAAIRRTRLWERAHYRQTGDSPFGISFRPESMGAQSELPFDFWDYRPPYLPDPLSIPVAANAEIVGEPMIFLIPFGKRQDSLDKPQPLDHAAGFSTMTALTVTIPAPAPWSPAVQAIAGFPPLTIQAGVEHLAEVGFDDEQHGKVVDFRPSLPLRFRW